MIVAGRLESGLEGDRTFLGRSLAVRSGRRVRCSRLLVDRDPLLRHDSRELHWKREREEQYMPRQRSTLGGSPHRDHPFAFDVKAMKGQLVSSERTLLPICKDMYRS